MSKLEDNWWSSLAIALVIVLSMVIVLNIYDDKQVIKIDKDNIIEQEVCVSKITCEFLYKEVNLKEGYIKTKIDLSLKTLMEKGYCEEKEVCTTQNIVCKEVYYGNLNYSKDEEIAVIEMCEGFIRKENEENCKDNRGFKNICNIQFEMEE